MSEDSFELVFVDLTPRKRGRPFTSKSSDPSFVKCGSCKNYVKVVDYAINRKGKRKKTCPRCIDNNNRQALKRKYLRDMKKRGQSESSIFPAPG